MKLFCVSISVCLLFLNFSFSNNAINNGTLSDKDKTSSTFFKSSRNSNRLALFQHLQSLILIKPGKAVTTSKKVANTIGYSTKDDVLEIFGTPNTQINNLIFVYTLNPQTGCKAIIEFDYTQTVVYIGIKDCN